MVTKVNKNSVLHLSDDARNRLSLFCKEIQLVLDKDASCGVCSDEVSLRFLLCLEIVFLSSKELNLAFYCLREKGLI